MRDAAERKEDGLETENRITDLSGYISRIAKETEDIDKDRVIVFRGENRIYDQPCYPNLFRRKILDITPCFEKNQFDGIILRTAVRIWRRRLMRSTAGSRAGFWM